MSKERTICPHCGGAVEILEDSWDPTTGWLKCIAPKGFEWTLPAGKLTPVVGPVLYTTSDVRYLTREAYISEFNIDPEIALQKMRAGR